MASEVAGIARGGLAAHTPHTVTPASVPASSALRMYTMVTGRDSASRAASTADRSDDWCASPAIQPSSASASYAAQTETVSAVIGNPVRHTAAPSDATANYAAQPETSSVVISDSVSQAAVVVDLVGDRFASPAATPATPAAPFASHAPISMTMGGDSRGSAGHLGHSTSAALRQDLASSRVVSAKQDTAATQN